MTNKYIYWEDIHSVDIYTREITTYFHDFIRKYFQFFGIEGDYWDYILLRRWYYENSELLPNFVYYMGLSYSELKDLAYKILSDELLQNATNSYRKKYMTYE